jgi:hypothetical protein
MILSDHAKGQQTHRSELQTSEVFIYHELGCKVVRIYSSR